MQHRFSRSRYRAHGLTVVELLVVIVIIGILAGLLLPAINGARKRGQITAISLEIQNLKNAVEQYKQTYGDYPPDGTNINVVLRHLRVVFPRIHPSELVFFENTIRVPDDPTGSTIMDPAEALCFFLGGFSEDPRYPLTGEGGPLVRVPKDNPNRLVRNNSRENAIFDFSPERLTVLQANFTPVPNWDVNVADYLFPVYIPAHSELPYVYFDSRTYLPRASYGGGNAAMYPSFRDLFLFNNQSLPTVGGAVVNNVDSRFWQWDSLAPKLREVGIARPYRSDQIRTPNQEDVHKAKWLNPESFQIISAGLNNRFGGEEIQGEFRRYSNIHFSSGDNYSDGDLSNITNFSRGQLEDELP